MKRGKRVTWGIRLLYGKSVEANKRLPQGVRAYFTVEAAMVMALVLSVVVMVIYIMFFQYNRCIMEQDVGTLVLKSSTTQISDKWALLQELEKQERQLDRDKYIAWEKEETVWEIKQNRIKVEQRGAMQFPFAELGGFNKESGWEATVVYENQYISPVAFLRIYNKVTGE